MAKPPKRFKTLAEAMAHGFTLIGSYKYYQIVENDRVGDWTYEKIRQDVYGDGSSRGSGKQSNETKSRSLSRKR